VKSLSVVPVVIVAQDYIGHLSTVTGRSMQPTLNPEKHDGTYDRDRVIVDRWSVREKRVTHGDVVALRYG